MPGSQLRSHSGAIWFRHTLRELPLGPEPASAPLVILLPLLQDSLYKSLVSRSEPQVAKVMCLCLTCQGWGGEQEAGKLSPPCH